RGLLRPARVVHAAHGARFARALARRRRPRQADWVRASPLGDPPPVRRGAHRQDGRSRMTDRRAFLAGTAAILACKSTPSPPQGEVTAIEDLMREHGVIRRVLVVYRECASRLRVAPTALVADAVQRGASLMRRFGEDYHEIKLEEAHVFPALANADTKALLAQ